MKTFPVKLVKTRDKMSNPLFQILILGGTGAMGKNLVHVLNEQGKFHIVVTSRKDRTDFGNVEYRKGDAHDVEWIGSIFQERKWDAIVDFMKYSTIDFQNCVEDLLKATDQYVFLSSSRVYADAGEIKITETSPRLLDVCKDEDYLKTDEYALAKARQENILFCSKSKNWTIIRPYITFSEERLQLGTMEKEKWLIPALNNRPIVFSRDIADRITTMTSGLAVAKCIAALLVNSRAKGEVFQIVSNESVSWHEIFKWYIDIFKELKGVAPAIHMTDKWDARLGGGKYQCKYDRLYNRSFDNSKIRQFVSADVFESMEVSLKNAARKFIETYQPDIQDLNQNVEWARGLATGDFLPVREIVGLRRKMLALAYKLNIIRRKRTNRLWN